jgi:hypothetical protein
VFEERGEEGYDGFGEDDEAAGHDGDVEFGDGPDGGLGDGPWLSGSIRVGPG